MNTKSTLLLGAIGLASLSAANAARFTADQYVYMTGSTAGRAAAFATLNAANQVFDAVGPTDHIGVNNSSQMIFIGHLKGEAGTLKTTIKCSWSGSEAGISDLAAPATTEAFIADDGTTGGDVHTVDLACADNAIAFSQNPKATSTLTATKVAVIPFKWVKEKGSSANLTGVSEIFVRNCLNNRGRVIQSFGCPNDLTKVYVSGRDIGSGTRCNTFGTSGFGINSSPQQVQIDSSGNMIDQVGDGTYLGDYGYTSGGNLATQMGVDITGKTDQVVGSGSFSVIAYLGIGDATTALGLGATELSFDCTSYSLANLQACCYPFWGYYHAVKKTAATGFILTTYNNFVANVGPNADDVVLVKLTDMDPTCRRTGPTTDPFHQ
jgi:hypothetical protein